VKILLVTSQLTYMPDNYRPVLQGLLESHWRSISGVIILKNSGVSRLGSALGLHLYGAHRMAKTLTNNFMGLVNDPRKPLMQSYSVPLYFRDTINDEWAIDLMKDQQIDLVINLRTRCIYKKKILKLPTYGCINIHHGLLPKYRGTLCDLYALAQNRPAGFTVHKMDAKIDNGEIIRVCQVGQNQTDYLSYLKSTMQKEVEVLREILDQLQHDQKFSHTLPNFCDGPIYSKNPSYQQIKDLKSQGMLL